MKNASMDAAVHIGRIPRDTTRQLRFNTFIKTKLSNSWVAMALQHSRKRVARKLIAISTRLHRVARSNNDTLNALAMVNKFRLKQQMEQQSASPQKRKAEDATIGRTVMLSLPNTIRGMLSQTIFVNQSKSVCITNQRRNKSSIRFSNTTTLCYSATVSVPFADTPRTFSMRWALNTKTSHWTGLAINSSFKTICKRSAATKWLRGVRPSHS